MKIGQFISVFLGRRAEAQNELPIAESLTLVQAPDDGSGCRLSNADYEALLDASRRQVVSNPKEWTGHFNLGLGYQARGKMVEAISAFRRPLRYQRAIPMPRPPWRRRIARVGKRLLRKRFLRTWKIKERHVSPYIRCTIYASLGEKGKSVELVP